MSEHSELVGRADSFIQNEGPAPSPQGRRRRTFLATPASIPEPHPDLDTVRTEASAEDDDLPVLTEVVPAEAAVSNSVPRISTEDRFDETQVSIMASEIAHAIGQQLTWELPSLLEATLTTAGEELRAGITSTMETALRDYLARRKQLRLPLDEPGNAG